MVDLVVKTKLKSREVKQRFASLPKIIAGEAPDPNGVRRLYFAVFARKLYSLIYQAYKLKSQGSTDSTGASWRALKKSTVRRRSSPGYVSKFPLSAKLLINRVNDHLLESFKPGIIAGTNYIPPETQKYLLEANRLILGSEVEYAGHVHKKRRLWPARMKAWIAEASDTALNYVLVQTARNLGS